MSPQRPPEGGHVVPAKRSASRDDDNQRQRSRVLQRHPELGFGLRLHLVERDAVGELDQCHAVLAVLVDGEYRQIRHHHVDDLLAGQRQVALLQELRAVLGGMLHHHHHALDPGDEVHRAAHPLDHLAGDHPVGEVAVLSHLHRAEDRQVDMAAAHHAERIGGGEIAGRRQFAHGLLAGVDEVGVFLALIGERPHAEHAVLALQVHVDAVGDIVRDQRRNADAEIDVIAVAQFLGRARGHLFAGPGHQTSTPVAAAAAGALARLRVLRNSMRLLAASTSTMRLTKMPGVWMWSGSIWPAGTRCSTSATVTLAAVAIIGLKLRAVLRYTRFPAVSPFQAWTMARSANSPRSMMYFSPSNSFTSLPSAIRVPTPVLV